MTSRQSEDAVPRSPLLVATTAVATTAAAALLVIGGSGAQDSRRTADRETSNDKDVTRSEVAIAGGKATLSYCPMEMKSTSLADQQSRGMVWSMSGERAAILETDVALVSGKLVIPPGRHLLSSWQKKRGAWQLLIFAKGPNYKSGTPYLETTLRVKELEEATTTLRLALRKRRDQLTLSLWAGKTRLRHTFLALPVTAHKGRLAGKPAIFEIYNWPADPRTKNRVRNFEMFKIGRVRRDGAFGAVYDIHCKSDGKGIFVVCKSDSLAKNRDRLAATNKRLQLDPGNAELRGEFSALRQAVDAQAKLQRSVMLPGTVIRTEERSARLHATPNTEGETTSFELRFGLQRAEFKMSAKAFRKLDWR